MGNDYNTQLADRRLHWLKRWIWIYFWLLIFEGALRKWIVPPLSAPLLLVRDPIALIIYAQAYRCHKFSMNKMWPFALLLIGMLLLAIVQIDLGINTVAIAIYGLRSYVLHLPLALVMAETLTGEDVRKFGRRLLLLSVPMTVLIVAQYYAPASAWLNAGTDGGGQLMAAAGHVRPAGTFSFTSGSHCFVMLVAAFVLYALMRPGTYPRWLLWPAALATIVTVPLLGSRTTIFTMAALLSLGFLSGISNAARALGLVKLVGALLLATLIAIQLPFFNDAVTTMSTRWQVASKSEGDVQRVLSKRVLGVFESGFESVGTTQWLGKGIGMGSNFAGFLLQNNPKSFLLSEMEWPRVVLEFGPIFGLAFLGLRVCVALYIALQALRALKRNATLPLLLLPAFLPLIVMTVMEQPTYLGFMIFGSGLCLTAARSTKFSMMSPARPQYAGRDRLSRAPGDQNPTSA